MNNPDEATKQLYQGAISRADPAFKTITGQLAALAGIKSINPEFQQTTTADLVLEIPAHAKIENHLLSFLTGFQFAVIDFKGQADTLDLPKFLMNIARTALLCAKTKVEVQKVLNLIVSSRYPQDLLNLAGHSLTAVSDQNWLWRGSFFFQEIAIISCRDLPVEPRYYEWLIFAPADSDTWKQLFRELVREGRQDLLREMREMRPKEFKAMTVDFKKELTPQERLQLFDELADVIKEELPELMEEAPAAVKTIIQALTQQQRETLRRLLEAEDFLQSTNSQTPGSASDTVPPPLSNLVDNPADPEK